MYDENNSYYDRIKKQLTASQLAERNVLGRLKLAIGVLPTLHQKLLACDYVEHGWQTLGEKGTSDIPDFIIRVRRFLLNEGDIESLHREGWEIVHIEQSKNPRRPWGAIAHDFRTAAGPLHYAATTGAVSVSNSSGLL